MGRPRTFRLSEQNYSAPASTMEPRNEPVTMEKFMAAWGSFINSNQNEHILTSAMRKAFPEQVTATEFRILVEHPAQQQAFEGNARLISFLRDALKNDSIIIKAELNPAMQGKKPLPPHELLSKAMNGNPVLADFLKSIDPEIA